MHDETRRQRLAEDGLPPPEILDAWEVPDPSPDAIDRMFTAPTLERPMHAAPRRSLLVPVAIGFLVAAGLLLSFWIGRSSVEPRVIEAPVPVPQVVVTEPSVAAACPEPEPTPPCPEIEPVTIDVGGSTAPAPRHARTRRTTPKPSISPDLKNPFAPATARLHFGTNKGVGPAEVWLDGKHIGSTPLANVKVQPGQHSVEYRFDNGKVVVRRFQVDDGDTQVIKLG